MTTTSLWGSRIDWNHVFYFSEVATHGSIKDAAHRLNLSPSTLSTHISQLEKDLYVKLFNRLHRKISLTPQGAQLFQYAKQMFETGRRLIDVVSPIPLGQYPVSIGLVPGPSMPFAYRVVTEFVTNYDSVNIRISQTDSDALEKGLSSARFDFGFSPRPPERKEIVHQLISNSPLKFYVSEIHAQRSFSELVVNLPIVVCGAENSGVQLTERMLEESELSPRSIITCDYPGLVFELCQKGCAIGVLGQDLVKQLESGTLKTLRGPRGAPEITEKLYVFWAKESDNSKAVKQLQLLLKSTRREDKRSLNIST